MRRGEVFVFLGLLFGVFFVNGVIAQADVCLKETAPLFTASQKIYLNDPLNVAKTNIAESEMSNFLKRGVFPEMSRLNTLKTLKLVLILVLFLLSSLQVLMILFFY
mgnify:CR=1 FL=1